jgi:hypothetical protein
MQPSIFCCRLAKCNVEAFAKLTNHRHHLVQIRGCFFRSVSTYWVESLSKNKLTSDNALLKLDELIIKMSLSKGKSTQNERWFSVKSQKEECNNHNNKGTVDEMMMKGDEHEPAAGGEREAKGEQESPWAVFQTKYPFLTDHINLIKKNYQELKNKEEVVTPIKLTGTLLLELSEEVGGKFLGDPQIAEDALEILKSLADKDF